VRGLILAAISPDNTPHGYNWTFAFPMLLFIVIALVLYLLFSRPHRRVPRQPVSAGASPELPAPEAARAASVAGGLSLAPGGGATESQHEPAGAHLVASIDPADLGPEEAGADDAGADDTGAEDAGAEDNPADADASGDGSPGGAGDGTEAHE
jgi:hypothetical protein